MAMPKESNKEAMAAWINSGERGILNVKCNFVSSNPMEVLGMGEPTTDSKAIKRQYYKLAKKVSGHL